MYGDYVVTWVMPDGREDEHEATVNAASLLLAVQYVLDLFPDADIFNVRRT